MTCPSKEKEDGAAQAAPVGTMDGNTQEYTVKQLGTMAGVSVRTLHYYDAVGLLKPARIGANGYRLYGREELLRLREILVLRELDVSLSEIAAMLSLDARDRADRLTKYRARFAADLSRRHDLLRTLDRTLVHLKGDGPVDMNGLYDGIEPETQAQYEDWLRDRYGDFAADILDRSRVKTVLTPDGKQTLPGAAMRELEDLENALVSAYETGMAIGAEPLTERLEAHRDWVGRQWGRPCTPEAYAGLAELYLSHPDFVARYETLSPGFSIFLTDAMKAHAEAAS